jgi:hypothetical protein
MLSRAVNLMLQAGLYAAYRMKKPEISFSDFSFYYVHLLINHGFCVWVRK